MKKLIILLLTALVLSSCSANPAQQTTTTAAVTVSVDTWEYEYYVEDINYYMTKYVEALDKVTEATELMDYRALNNAYGDCVRHLISFMKSYIPHPLKKSTVNCFQ